MNVYASTVPLATLRARILGFALATTLGASGMLLPGCDTLTAPEAERAEPASPAEVTSALSSPTVVPTPRRPAFDRNMGPSADPSASEIDLEVLSADSAGMNARFKRPGYPTHNGEISNDGRLIAQNWCPPPPTPPPGQFTSGGSHVCLQVFRPEAAPSNADQSRKPLFDSTSDELDGMYSPTYGVIFNASDLPSSAAGAPSLFDRGVYDAVGIEVEGLDGAKKPPMLRANKATMCQGPQAGPYACACDAPEGICDCYDITFLLHVNAFSSGSAADKNRNAEPGVMYLASRDLTVYVSSPKSSDAAIHRVVVKGTETQKISGATFGGVHVPIPLPFYQMAEMNVTRDGKLLGGRVDRTGKSPFDNYKWTLDDGRTAWSSERGETPTSVGNAKSPGPNTLIYAYADTPCDASQFGAVAVPANIDPRRRFVHATANAENKALLGTRVTNPSWSAVTPTLLSLRQLAAAPYDRRINTQYGLAATPFRDNLGNVLPETGVISGSYGWIDQGGKNFVFFVGGERLCAGKPTCTWNATTGALEAPSRYPATATDWTAVDAWGIATAIVGSWTRGRVVVLDGALNLSDFHVSVPDDKGVPRVRLKLYEDGTKDPANDDVWVRLNETSGAFNHRTYFDLSDSYRDRFVKSPVRFHSTEALFTYYSHMRPKTPRDVVWYITRGRTTDEVAFDDFMDPNVLVFSEMNAAVAMDSARTTYQDGWTDTTVAPFRWSFNATGIRVQNSGGGVARGSGAAGGPQYGVIEGSARVEPVAEGGVRGKGLWLSDGSALRYDWSTPTLTGGFYAGLFFDPRLLDANLGKEHVLLRLASATTGRAVFVTVRHDDGAAIRFFEAEGTTTTGWRVVRKLGEWVPPTPALLAHLKGASRDTGAGRYFHLGLWTAGNQQNVRLLLDGNYLGSVTLSARLGRVESQPFGVGLGTGITPYADGQTQRSFVGFRGWIDEVRVVSAPETRWVASLSNPRPVWTELACNYAHGTLLGLGTPAAGQEGPEWATADRYSGGAGGPYWEPARFQSSTSYARYLCWTDYTRDYGINVNEPRRPDGTLIPTATPLRARIYFREGQPPLVTNMKQPSLFYDLPRPISFTNNFCLTCHADSQDVPGLRLAALVAGLTDVIVPVELRRQPFQPPHTESFGNIANLPDVGVLRFQACARGVWPDEVGPLLLQPNNLMFTNRVPPVLDDGGKEVITPGICNSIDTWILPSATSAIPGVIDGLLDLLP